VEFGRQYQPKQDAAKPESVESTCRCEIVERPARPALTIRTQYAGRVGPNHRGIRMDYFPIRQGKGYIPAGPLFVAYHGFDGQMQESKWISLRAGYRGAGTIQISEIPAGNQPAIITWVPTKNCRKSGPRWRNG
jgi:hypothetical protein